MKRPGRPPLDANDESIPLTVSLPSKQLKVVSQRAEQDRMSIQDYIRRVLRDASAENKSV